MTGLFFRHARYKSGKPDKEAPYPNLCAYIKELRYDCPFHMAQTKDPERKLQSLTKGFDSFPSSKPEKNKKIPPPATNHSISTVPPLHAFPSQFHYPLNFPLSFHH